MKNTTKRAARAAIGLSTLLALALIGTGCPTDDDGGGGTGNGNGLTVTAAGGATSVEKGGTLQFSVSPAESVTWSITTSGVAGGTSIDTSGQLTVAAAETNSSLAIKAESTADASRSGTATVTVNPAAGESKTLTLSEVSVNMRYVPAGSFQRDATATNVSVITKGYWLAETETTQELFQAVMGSNPSSFSSSPAANETQEKRPVENVNWYHAIAFCNKLSLANGKEAVYSVNGISDWAALQYSAIPTTYNGDWVEATMDRSKNGYRLPTEMEWMWAAMGADKTAQPNTSGYTKDFAGSDESNSIYIANYAWYGINSGDKTHEVGKKNPNELGLKDMSGNVYEWCWDWHGGTNGSTGTVAETGTLTDYTGAASGSGRVRRGGCWGFVYTYCAVAYRSINLPTAQDNYQGFRFACPAD